jgi:hypothetical protein
MLFLDRQVRQFDRAACYISAVLANTYSRSEPLWKLFTREDGAPYLGQADWQRVRDSNPCTGLEGADLLS